MQCTVCRHGETRPGATAVAFTSDDRTIVVTRTPAEVCENCGEPYLNDRIANQLLEIAAEARKARAQVFIREFGVTAA